ncbi:hypothetical protein HZH68_011519 [Vespula germanica]|uniref:Uncharacterized protein n=1 Tax=Vespula germanica TaxID=30212 RepID=A0A834JQV1_VESGE|nr:hypothetical protein HZH68_011519 [Vespula germanica]
MRRTLVGHGCDYRETRLAGLSIFIRIETSFVSGERSAGTENLLVYTCLKINEEKIKHAPPSVSNSSADDDDDDDDDDDEDEDDEGRKNLERDLNFVYKTTKGEGRREKRFAAAATAAATAGAGAAATGPRNIGKAI